MKTTLMFALVLGSVLALSPAPRAAIDNGYGLTVLVDGAPRLEYAARGTRYVEALRGREFALRITNPFPYRVGVALSVDGLNTIDASHAPAVSAVKWVLEPYGSAEIAGWQIGNDAMRRFFFTGERGSYANKLGKTEDLGVIEAVFFRERRPQPPPCRAEKAEPMAPSASRDAASGPPEAKMRNAVDGVNDEYAATGMGRRDRHEVVDVAVDLERTASATIRLRYEFRAQLVALGVLPGERPAPLARREHARGFDGSWCPEVD